MGAKKGKEQVLGGEGAIGKGLLLGEGSVLAGDDS